MAANRVLVRHVYEQDAGKFEEEVNEALQRIESDGGLVGDIKYASDAAVSDRRKGGYGALIIYEMPLKA
jgi:hypothetical protein